MTYLLFASVFVVATCGLIYELIAGALASYLLGDSITQFSTIIGCYLFFMGVGSYLSRYIEKNLIRTFITIEICIGVIGGVAAALLFLGFHYIEHFRFLLYFMVGLTGTLVGLEIPLLMRIMEKEYELKDLVSKVFTFDYIGALIASVLFPLFIMPYMGMIRASFFFGGLNIAVGGVAIYYFRHVLTKSRRGLTIAASVSFVGVVAGYISSDWITHIAEQTAYDHKIIYAKTTPYQRLVLTRSGSEYRLFLNGNLQFSSRDEYRYHEGLVHVGLSRLESPKNVLVLGGGDGLAVREILKYPSVESVLLVDLDPEMTHLFQKQQVLRGLNNDALNARIVSVVNKDAFLSIKEQADQSFDFIVIDFPDPSNFSIGKLYSTIFFKEVKRILKPSGWVSIQSTSPYVARKTFWCIAHTMEAVGLRIFPYHIHVPLFGSWGFVLACQQREREMRNPRLPTGLKFLTTAMIPGLFVFPEDMSEIPTEMNQLHNQMVVRYFEEEWAAHAE